MLAVARAHEGNLALHLGARVAVEGEDFDCGRLASVRAAVDSSVRALAEQLAKLRREGRQQSKLWRARQPRRRVGGHTGCDRRAFPSLLHGAPAPLLLLAPSVCGGGDARGSGSRHDGGGGGDCRSLLRQREAGTQVTHGLRSWNSGGWLGPRSGCDLLRREHG